VICQAGHPSEAPSPLIYFRPRRYCDAAFVPDVSCRDLSALASHPLSFWRFAGSCVGCTALGVNETLLAWSEAPEKTTPTVSPTFASVISAGNPARMIWVPPSRLLRGCSRTRFGLATAQATGRDSAPRLSTVSWPVEALVGGSGGGVTPVAVPPVVRANSDPGAVGKQPQA